MLICLIRQPLISKQSTPVVVIQRREKKKQKREWKERRRLERKKSKECKNQARQRENHVERETCNAPQNRAVSHTLTVPARSQTDKQLEEITVEAEVREHLNRTEAILDPLCFSNRKEFGTDRRRKRGAGILEKRKGEPNASSLSSSKECGRNAWTLREKKTEPYSLI